MKEIATMQTDFRKLAGTTGRYNPAGILDHEVDARVFDSPDNLYYSVFFPATSLWRNSLRDVLSFARPRFKLGRDYQQSPAAIIADWNFLDHLDNPENQYLAKIHEFLEPHWSVWDTHDRQRYLLAIGTPTSELVTAVFDRFQEHVMTEDVVIANFADWISASAHRTDEKYPKFAYKNEHDFLRRHYPALKGMLKQYYPNLTFKGLKDEEGRRFTRAFFENLPDDYSLRRSLISLGVLKYYFFPMIVMEEGARLSGSIIDTESYFVVPNHSLQLQGENHYRFNYGTSWMDFRLNDDGVIEEETNRFVETEPEKYGLYPWILWRINKTTGEREILINDIPEELSYAVDERASTRLGLMVVGGLKSRDQRDQMPRWLALPGTRKPGKKQLMREAQTVLLLPMFNRLISTSPVLPQMEETICAA